MHKWYIFPTKLIDEDLDDGGKFPFVYKRPEVAVVELDTFVTNYGLNLERKYVYLEQGRGSMLNT